PALAGQPSNDVQEVNRIWGPAPFAKNLRQRAETWIQYENQLGDPQQAGRAGKILSQIKQLEAQMQDRAWQGEEQSPITKSLLQLEAQLPEPLALHKMRYQTRVLDDTYSEYRRSFHASRPNNAHPFLGFKETFPEE